MSQELKAYSFVILSAGAIAGGLFAFEPLTSVERNPSLQRGESVNFEEALVSEHAFCRRHGTVLDCACFANVSAYVVSQRVPRAPFAQYPDRQRIARSQASDVC